MTRFRFLPTAAALLLAALTPVFGQTATPSAAQLLATLDSTAPLAQKWVAARRLALVADAQAVPKLAAMLDDEHLSELARSVLEALPDPAADQALRQALSQLKGRLLVGAIVSIGVRHDAQSADALRPLLRDPDPEVAGAAVAAWAQIDAPNAAPELWRVAALAPTGVRTACYEALLQCAERLHRRGETTAAVATWRQLRESTAPGGIRAAALRRWILADPDRATQLLAGQLVGGDETTFSAVLQAVREEAPRAEVADALAAESARFSADRQARLVEALAQRGDAAARRLLLQAAEQGEKPARLAALRALASQPDEVVPSLAKWALDADPDLAKAAQESLAAMPGPQAEAAILHLLESEPLAARSAGLEMVGRRRLQAALPILLKEAVASEPAQRKAALNALASAGGADDLPVLLALLTRHADRVDLPSAERALVALGRQAPHPDQAAARIVPLLGKAPAVVQPLLLRALGELGGAKAFESVSAAVTKEAPAEVRRAALQALAQWRTLEAGLKLLGLASSLPEEYDRLLCLTSCAALVADEELAEAQRLTLARQTAALAGGAEAKKALVKALGTLRSPEAFVLIEPHLDAAGTKSDAAGAILGVAGRLLQGPQAANRAADVIDPLYQVSLAVPELGAQATALLKQAYQLQGPRGPSEGALKFAPHRLGNFRSEACGVADFNGDGRPDIVAGELIYLAPDWKAQPFRTLKGSVDQEGKGYRWDFANLPLDVDADGKTDVVSVDWFDQHAIWFRNPGASAAPWAQSLIEKNGNYETAELLDVLGEGKPRAVVPVVAPTVWYEPRFDRQGSFVKHVVCSRPMNFGVGVGDIDGDGRPDIIRPDAWFEALGDPRLGVWSEHPLALGARQGKATHTAQILVFDVNGDGLNDLIASDAHGYGIFWYEQVREERVIRFKQHLIDDSWTQPHALELADLDGCGTPELIVSKRFMAHNGGDPEETAPLGLYYYKLSREFGAVWTKHAISYNEGMAAALNIPVADLDGDGDLDIVVTGKWGGPAWFENLGNRPPGAALQPNSPTGEPFALFPFCIDWHDAKKRTVAQQAPMLKELGYAGVGHIWLDQVAERLKTLDDAGLKLFQITMVVDVTPGRAPYDARLKDVLALLHGRQVQFDLLLNGLKPSDPAVDPHAVAILREMSELARPSGAQLLLYPHVGSWVERIEDSVRLAAKVNRPNVGVQFNLCHWLRVDKSRDYEPLLRRAMPRLWGISLNGADERDPRDGWDRYIQPLGQGNFDVARLLQTLDRLGYRGAIGLQCYGIGGDTREHLANSIQAWRKLRPGGSQP